MHEVVLPNAWVVLKLPSERTRTLQVTPNTTISLGKYGSFPSNLIIERPYHLTYEIQDKSHGEDFCRLRVVPPSELYADVFADEDGATPLAAQSRASPEDDGDQALPSNGVEDSVLDDETEAAIAAMVRETASDSSTPQLLSHAEIEALKVDGAAAGKDLISKLMKSHKTIDQKTLYSLAKYKLLKTKKFIRRFTVLPLDVYNLGAWHLDAKDPSKILDMREEHVGLLGCWANVHFGGESVFFGHDELMGADPAEAGEPAQGVIPEGEHKPPLGGRWLIVDDTGGLLTAAMAERMGILHPTDDAARDGERVPREEAHVERQLQTPILENGGLEKSDGTAAVRTAHGSMSAGKDDFVPNGNSEASATTQDSQPAQVLASSESWRGRSRRQDDFHIPYSRSNTLTLITATPGQHNLFFLKYFGYDSADPDHPPHPLAAHLLSVSWLQLIDPGFDYAYSTRPPPHSPEALAAMKAARRGTYHRKRRRWARTRYAVDDTRAGGFSGLVVASTMDPVSILRETLPLLAGGAAVAVYSPTREPLVELADCFSLARRGAWNGRLHQPAAVAGLTIDELERWEGSPEFPINPTLLLNVDVQTSRARRWQVLPGRTHPLMTAKGGPEGYVFTAWKAKPADGKVEARGRSKRRKMYDEVKDQTAQLSTVQ